ncbi:TetR/AcrR family transcriptional regulator [Streptomyces sp. NPDC090798]|uniref:TetR/AcrR family transcriptional regulator n=1 Tax=Streptomyces sp. NPDC090798 TaxID=3365968 RepID=UPI00380ADE48
MARARPLRTRPPVPLRRRLDPELTACAHTAVIDLLREIGYDALTVEAVAARANCSKTSLYRRFSGKQEPVTEALRHLSPFDVDTVDTGSLAGDLHALIDGRGEDGLREDAALIRGLVSALHTDPEISSALRQPGPGRLDALIARAVDRGELADRHAASYHLPCLLLSAVLTRSLVDDVPVAGAYMHHFIDVVILRALSAVDGRHWYPSTNIAPGTGDGSGRAHSLGAELTAPQAGENHP